MSGSWLGAKGPVARIGSAKGGRLLQPGGRLKIGRHRSNDLVVCDPHVSRFHARVDWREGAPRPTIRDLGSQTGLYVDGCRLREAALSHGSQIELGSTVLPVALASAEDTPALLDDDSDRVALFCDDGDWEHGILLDDREVAALLVRLERERRSGTLDLSWGRRRATLTFYDGRILLARSDSLLGQAALDRALRARGASYAFRTQYAVGESFSPLNVYPSQALREKRRSKTPTPVH